jgi:CheY-like chemotaxis protein
MGSSVISAINPPAGGLGGPLLVVEDSDEDFMVLERLISQRAVSRQIYRCADGDEALAFLLSNVPNVPNAPDASEPSVALSSGVMPSIILLDLNLPGTDGREVLEHLKQNQTLKVVPIVVMTTSNNPKDIEFCYQNGANGYLVKPVDTKALSQKIEAFVNYWLEVNTPPPWDVTI